MLFELILYYFIQSAQEKHPTVLPKNFQTKKAIRLGTLSFLLTLQQSAAKKHYELNYYSIMVSFFTDTS